MVTPTIIVKEKPLRIINLVYVGVNVDISNIKEKYNDVYQQHFALSYYKLYLCICLLFYTYFSTRCTYRSLFSFFYCISTLTKRARRE
jgi:hypothetical protein